MMMMISCGLVVKKSTGFSERGGDGLLPRGHIYDLIWN